jgi:hypothetical protein
LQATRAISSLLSLSCRRGDLSIAVASFAVPTIDPIDAGPSIVTRRTMRGWSP